MNEIDLIEPRHRIRARAAPLALALLLAACGGGGSGGGSSNGPSQLAPGSIGHVFVIVLENKRYEDTFGSGPNGPHPYLGGELPAQGALLRQYYGIGHDSLTNYLAMIGGQSPNPETQDNCGVFSDWQGTAAPDADGQVTGSGCVYPPAIRTLANQFEDAGYAWKGYMEDMGNDLARDGSATCSHPPLGAVDETQAGTATDQYATKHDPFVYFHAIIDDAALCDAHVVPMSGLADDLAAESTTPAFSFIVSNLCNSGHDEDCADGHHGGRTAAERFLEEWVPRITASPAFRHDGLLVVTFDEAGYGEDDACCAEPTGPNTGKPGQTGPGGGRVGAVLLSPFIAPGTTSNHPYNHYSLLRSIEDLFGFSHLGHAAQDGLAPLGGDVFTRPEGAP